MPGVEADYTASLAGTVTSSYESTSLTVRDPSSTATAAWSTGPTRSTSPLQLKVGSSAFAPLSTAGTPLALASWNTPVSARAVQVDLKQHIAATESLLRGAYGKTIVFTLSATTP